MKDTEYAELLEFVNMNGCLYPSNQNSVDLLSIVKHGESQTFQNVTRRDEKFHKCYFSLLNFIWCAMPPHFRAKVPCKSFYLFLKMLKGEYDEIFSFKDGKVLIEYHSISFSKMDNAKFKAYVAEMLPVIYDALIFEVYKPDQANIIIDTIEEEYKKFLSKL